MALRLTCALTDNPRTRPLLDGRVAPDGIDLELSTHSPGEIFLRQLKDRAYDVSEMSLASLAIATARGGRDWTALPVFTWRQFFHTGIWVRRAAGIDGPADLRGTRVGVPEFQQTAAVWIRSVLQHKFGVDPRSMEWFMERAPDVSHGGATGFTPPAGFRMAYVPPTTNLGAMLVAGELDAVLFYVPHGSKLDRSTLRLEERDEVRLLFPDPDAEARRTYAAGGLYPINHGCVVRRSIAERDPSVLDRLFAAFSEAQRLAEAADPPPFPMPYGVEPARRELETIVQALYEQGLTQRLVGVDELFAAPLVTR